ncbi:hypothetical protein FKR81_32520 [Lentzea tibetensis]|uniref:Uncharacterized protein n=1 Tax=Lentzea tibetensis TaxID=2591470 RepID=A0A563EK94_9PSEU|nr:hypothetical protein [Lentzea tibetensis]TWP47437.1 hypothetical protein FKR81_32520 [Lentzea tibetensis]
MPVTSLWIGPPGRLRVLLDAATDYDRTADIGVTEFRSLAGGITTTSLATPPRRLTLAFTGLREAEARWLDALARRVFGPVSLAVLEPGIANVLDAAQSQGAGPLSGYQLIGSGQLTQSSSRTVAVTGTASGSTLRWRHPQFPGWPVTPGLRVGFTSSLAPSAGLCVLDYLNAAGLPLGSSAAAPVVFELPPPNTIYVRPAVQLQALANPVQLGAAWLSLDTPVLPGAVPIGEGCPAMTVTSYSDKPRFGHRDMTVSLAEVRSATG